MRHADRQPECIERLKQRLVSKLAGLFANEETTRRLILLKKNVNE